MKRSIVLGMGLMMVIGMGIGAVSFAEGMKDVEKEMDPKGAMCDRMQGGRSMGGHQMFGKMQPQMVASSDGSVVVLSGNKLVKYDKNLNVVKEVEIQNDMDVMPMKMMGEMGRGAMGKDCPMMKKAEDKAVEVKK